jgi:hypothetical protein
MNLALSSKDSRCTLTTWLLARAIVTNPSRAIPARIAVEEPYASMITAVIRILDDAWRVLWAS